MLSSLGKTARASQAKRLKVVFDEMEMGTFDATSLMSECPTWLVVGAEVRIPSVMVSFNVTAVDRSAGTVSLRAPFMAAASVDKVVSITQVSLFQPSGGAASAAATMAAAL